LPEYEPTAWRATSRITFNQTARTLHHPGSFGVPRKIRRVLGRNSECLIGPRRDTGCSHQRIRAKSRQWPAAGSAALLIWGNDSIGSSSISLNPIARLIRGSLNRRSNAAASPNCGLQYKLGSDVPSVNAPAHPCSSPPLPLRTPRCGLTIGTCSNERDDPVTSRIDDCDRVVFRVECVEKALQLRHCAGQIIRDSLDG
jgi:hypothetical protein